MTTTYETPEGFGLPRQLLMPEVRAFPDVLTYVRDWDFATMNRPRGPGLLPEQVFVDGHEVGPFCSYTHGPHMAVTPTDATTVCIHERITGGGMFGLDVLSFGAFYHRSNDRVLIVVKRQGMLSDYWLAYVRPGTMPHGAPV
jgi:hypothetical protein